MLHPNHKVCEWVKVFFAVYKYEIFGLVGQSVRYCLNLVRWDIDGDWSYCTNRSFSLRLIVYIGLWKSLLVLDCFSLIIFCLLKLGPTN